MNTFERSFKQVTALIVVLFLVGCGGEKASTNPGKEQDEQQSAIVLMGDSITDFWEDNVPRLFEQNPYINKGISGQTTSQMLNRFKEDVIDLNPKAVVILAGTNDIAGNSGPTTREAIENNLAAMAEMARENDIKVILSSVLPADQYPWNKEVKPADKIVELNNWIQDYARQNGITYCNYYPALVNEQGGLKNKFSGDGVHPNTKGYKVMEPILQKAIKTTLQK